MLNSLKLAMEATSVGKQFHNLIADVGAKGDNNQLTDLVALYPQTFQLNWISIVILMDKFLSCHTPKSLL